MIICLVTDRRRLGAAIGARPDELIDALEAQVVAAARAGVDFVQIREPDLEAAALTALVRSITFKCRDTPAKILVNDRFDVALAADAAGVQLKESSFSPDEARRLAPPRIPDRLLGAHTSYRDCTAIGGFPDRRHGDAYSLETAGRLPWMEGVGEGDRRGARDAGARDRRVRPAINSDAGGQRRSRAWPRWVPSSRQ